jgi:hypothetical protein
MTTTSNYGPPAIERGSPYILAFPSRPGPAKSPERHPGVPTETSLWGPCFWRDG